MGSKSKHDPSSEKSKKHPNQSTPIQHHKKSKKKKDLDKPKDREEKEDYSCRQSPKVELSPTKSTSKKLKGHEMIDSTFKEKHNVSNQEDFVSKDLERHVKKEHKSNKKRKSIFAHENPQPHVKESGHVSETSVNSDVPISPKKKKKKHKKNKEENIPSDVETVSIIPSTTPKFSQPASKKNEPVTMNSDHSSCEDEIESVEHATAQHAADSKNENKTEKESSNKYNTDCFEGWTKSELFELVNRMMKAIPKNDSLKYNSRVEKLDWDQVKFEPYSAEECKEKWKVIEKRLRGYRLLDELLSDAKEWIEKPWTDFYRSGKKNRHPDLPKRPLTSYMLFYMDKKEKFAKKNPGLEMTNLSKLIAEKYKHLPGEKKEKYNVLASNMREEYKGKMQKFLQDHPIEALRLAKNAGGGGNKKGTLGMPGPVKPVPPFKLFLEDKIKQHQSDPGFSAVEFTAECKKKWKNMSRKKKTPWIRWAHERETKYLEEIKLYKSENPSFEAPPFKSVLSKEEKTILERMEGKPEKPPNSAYSLFSRIMLKDPQLKIKYDTPKARLKEIATLWKSVPKVDKEMYAEEVKRLIDSYKMEYAAYLDSLPEERREEELASNIPKRKTKAELQKINNKDGNQMKINDLMKKSTIGTKESVPNEDVFSKEPLPPPVEPFILFKNDITKDCEMSEKKVRKAWVDLSDKEKEKYSVKLQELKQQYFIDYRVFLTSLKPDELKTYSARKGNPVLNKTVVESESEGSVDSEASSSSDDDSEEEEEKEEEEDGGIAGVDNDVGDDDSDEEEEEKKEKVRQTQQPSKKEESSDSDSSDSDSGSIMKLKLN